MASSVNTNTGALIALQSLNSSRQELATVRNRVSTGLKVSSARDSGAVFAIASGLRAEQDALNAVKNTIQRAQSIIDVAIAAGDTITRALEEQKNAAIAVQSSIAGSAAATAHLADFNALGTQISAAVVAARFDGINLFVVGTNANNLVVQTGTTATYPIHNNMGPVTNLATGGGSIPRGLATVAAVETSLRTFTARLAVFGSHAKYLDRQLISTSKIQDSLEAGVGRLVDADLAKDSARLTALQTRQQLGVQALGIANQSGSSLLGLFR